ncbi:MULTISPECIES: hypothetical protein [Altibacter]|uniref:hypothetical protein n=1 Tax=Altibacter TaxID=1535231 RepID=UPI0005502AE5|nr:MULTISPECIES: hypothetical protein [Altibacter]MCW8982251.1 hypothetical protein [Altibacter sp.]MCW9038056.1 hypothetical protein [Altibacter sp.]
MQQSKYKLLRKGLLFDAVGMITMAIPVVGPFLDLLWAPYAAKKMNDMYSGTSGKIASVIVFVEEILPVSDFIPTFTLMWLYTYVFSAQKHPQPQPIEVKVNE